MGIQAILDTSQINELSSITNNGTANFAAGYEYIYSQFAGTGELDSNTEFWFKSAPLINSNDPLGCGLN